MDKDFVVESASDPLGVTSEQERAFDELFFASCPPGRDVAPVDDIVTKICDIRKDSDEDTGTGLLCNMLCSEATDGLMDITTYKRVIASWIKDMTKQHLHQPMSSFTASLTSSPLVSSYSAMFPTSFQGSEFPSPQKRLQFSHESLEAEGGSFRESLDINEIQQTVEQLKSENIRLKDQQHHIESHWELREESLKKLQSERDSLEKKVRVLTQQLEQKEEENRDLQQQVTTRENTSDALNSKLQEVEQQRALLEGDYNDLQLHLEETRNTVQRLEEQVRELEERENENVRRFQDHQVDYENLKDKLTDIAEDNTNLTQQLEEVKDENLSLQRECKMLESELEVTRTKIMRPELHTPIHSSTPHLEMPIQRHKSIREEIEDASGKSGVLMTSPSDNVLKSSEQEGDNMEDSMDQSFGSALDVSLSSLDPAEVEEYKASFFQQNKDQALQQIEELLGLNTSFSLREHPSLRVNSSIEVPDVSQKWEVLEKKLLKLVSDRKKLLDKVRSYQDKNAELKKKLTDLKRKSKEERTKELGDKVDQLTFTCRNLTEEVSQKDRQLAALREALEDKNREILKVQRELEELRGVNSELNEECVKLQKKCTDQTSKITHLNTEAGKAEQRMRSLEDQLRDTRLSHRRGMRTILNVVRESSDDGDDGEGDGDGRDQTDSTGQVADDSMSEDEEILTVGHVTDVLRTKIQELKEIVSRSIQTPQRQSAVHLTGSVLPDQIDIQPVPGGVKAGRLLVVEPVERVDIPGDPSVGSPRRKVLAKRDQQPLHIAPKPRPPPKQSSICWRIFKLVLFFLFFVVLVLGLFVTLTYLSEDYYCDEPCPSSISGLVYHTLHPYISVSHKGMPPL